MKKAVLIVWMQLVAMLAASAQEYRVESFEILPNDLTARIDGRVDGNGRKCGVIKVYVKDKITEVAGPSVGEIVDKGLEKRVYVTHDAKQIELYFKEYMPLRITFDDYNFTTLAGNMTYALKLTDGTGRSSGTSMAQTAPAPPQPSNGAVETFTVNGVSFDMVRVEGGSFQMGSNNGEDYEKPVHTENVATFCIGKTEVTQALWKAVMGDNPSEFIGDNNPVEMVSWDDCQEFVKRLSRITGKNFRLPTEAEWEYAAKGGSKSRGYEYSGSNDINQVAWYADRQTHPVAQKLDNELGIYDMSGNVWEWCSDCWCDNYSSPREFSDRVLRGGSWDITATFCRVACRNYNYPSNRLVNLGLRLAL